MEPYREQVDHGGIALDGCGVDWRLLVPPLGLEPRTCGLKDRLVWRLLFCPRMSSLRNMGLELQRHRWFGLAEYDGFGISCGLTAD
jgi:hypothetical protein